MNTLTPAIIEAGNSVLREIISRADAEAEELTVSRRIELTGAETGLGPGGDLALQGVEIGLQAIR